MATEIQGKVGPAGGPSDGTPADPRLTRDLGLCVTDLHGKFYEQSSRSQLYVATTASAGIAPGTALTATGALMLANPANSQKNLSILRAKLGYVSGTFGAAVIWWTQGVNPSTLPAETTAALRAAGYLNGSNSGDVAKAYSGVSLTTVPTIVRPTGFNLGTYAGAQTSLMAMQLEEVDGEFVVPPGNFIALEGIGAAGTSPLVNLSITYELVSP